MWAMIITGHSISHCPVPSWAPNKIGTRGGNSVEKRQALPRHDKHRHRRVSLYQAESFTYFEKRRKTKLVRRRASPSCGELPVEIEAVEVVLSQILDDVRRELPHQILAVDDRGEWKRAGYPASDRQQHLQRRIPLLQVGRLLV